MKTTTDGKIIRALFAAYAIAIAFPGPARAELADIADVPLANAPSDTVLPNLMYILDDSGSMQWDYMPDNIQTLTTGTQINNCKTATGAVANIAAVQCALGNPGSADGNTADFGEPPYFSTQFNQIYYSPDITYAPGTDYLGVSLGAQSPTAAKKDAYVNATTKNLTTTYPEVYYCNGATFTGSTSGTVLTVTAVTSGTVVPGQVLAGAGSGFSGNTQITSNGTGVGATGTYNINNSQNQASQTVTASLTNPSVAQLADTTLCKRNGVNNIQAAPNTYFNYWSNNVTAGTPLGAYPVATGATGTSFNNRVVRNTGQPYYFTIVPDEHCKDRNLVECTNSPVPVGAFTFPAPVRYCSSNANASAASPVSDPAATVNPKCRQKFNSATYTKPRYGRFTRVDIVAATPTYAKSANSRRVDCAGALSCTYAEELQNFANWYSYYRVRMSLMKTATGRSFLSIDDRYRVGFITINPGSPVVASRYLAISQFNAAQKSAWYTKLYATGSNGSTPLRQALSRVGRHYAGITTGINNGMPQDPIQYSCQQNFALLTTDGYYNDSTSSTEDTSGNQVGNQDNVPNVGPPFYVSRGNGTLDASNSQVVVTTPTSTLAQNICQANANTAFPGGGSNTPCGCAGSNKRIKQRTQIGSSSSTLVDGVLQGVASNVASTTFQDITACTVPLIVTTVTNYTETEQIGCSKNNAITFTTGLQGNATTGAIRNSTCTCATTNPSQAHRRMRTITYTGTVTTTDGVVTAGPTYSTAVLGGFSNATACAVGGAPSNVAASATPGASTPTGNGGTTLSIAGFAPNPQTTVTGPPTSVTTNGGTADTLADVAMYYYKNDLRTAGSPTIITNNVPTTDKDIAAHQHMVTFTLGLGLQGLMDYIPDYESNVAGDFANIKAGTPGACPWTAAGATCNWPVAVAASPSSLDDLWHAAVNGRGVYYSASDPNTLADGLSGALSALHVQTAAASASATSSPNITQTDNFIYSSTFRTVKWDGEIVAQRIDTTTGNILPAIEWSAQSLLDAQTAAATDSRTIYTFSSVAGNKLKSFTFANLTSGPVGSVAAEQPYFQNKCLTMSQCSLLTAGQQTIANTGTNLVNFLRGQRGDETTIFRSRDHVLGDPVNATPAFVRGPVHSFADVVTPNYASFKTANASRTPTLYIAANDGMLHAFNGNTAALGGGTEMWAYVPRIVMPNLHKLATDNWDVQHKFSVDGSPTVMDVYDTTNSVWKTILVAGLNKGGRGYYALDVTDPAAPKGLWEVCSDSTLCAVSDSDIGFTYGPPIITKRAQDGKWVVLATSGINNTVPGTGQGYLYVLDALTGAILQKFSARDGATTWGDTTTPSGLSKISAFANSADVDNTGLFVYGGDLFGNVWRFDLSVAPVAYPTLQTTGVQKLAQLLDGSSPPKPQSITTRPELGVIQGQRAIFIGTGRYVGVSDLSDPSTLVPALQWAYQQSLYAFKDKGSNYGNLRLAASPGLVRQTLTDTAGVRTISTNPVDWTIKDGWYVDFNPANTSPGERMNLDPQLQLKTLIMVANVPLNSACTVGGDSFNYQFNYETGAAISSSPGGAVGTKTTGQIAVGFVVIRLPGGALKQIVTGATGTKTTSAVYTSGSGGPPRRVSWRELIR